MALQSKFCKFALLEYLLACRLKLIFHMKINVKVWILRVGMSFHNYIFLSLCFTLDSYLAYSGCFSLWKYFWHCSASLHFAFGCCDDLLAFAFVHGAELCNSGLWRVWSKGLVLFIREGIWVDKCFSSLHTSCSCAWSMREYSFSTFILSENIRYLIMH